MTIETPKSVRKWFSKIGQAGGRIGGRQRVANQSPEEQSALGRRGATARWERERAKRDVENARVQLQRDDHATDAIPDVDTMDPMDIDDSSPDTDK